AGSCSALIGVLFALQQHDLKRLLAYHSIENVGIILIGLGLSLLLANAGHPALAALGLMAGLYHTLNHALFKGLLFMGAGAVLHATGTRDMESLGGLIHRMPITAVCFLVACLSISALPPFNGFVSEWLTFQTALQTPQLSDALLTAMVPFSSAMLALAGALAAACFVKVFGIVFLGQPRSAHAAKAHEVDRWMRCGMAIPALFCLLLGLLPAWLLPVLAAVPADMLHFAPTAEMHAHGWLWLTPMDATRASYSAPIALFGMMAVAALVYWRLHPKGASVRRSTLWSCGHPHIHARMQYNATSFSQPLRRIFAGVLHPDEQVHPERPAHKLLTRRVRHAVHVADPAVRHLYQPLGRAILNVSAKVKQVHQHGIHAWLAWTFATILLLLVLIG
ncbi:MAG: hydrogenase 4 subunit B, partial [Zetaproteobacteria bacterium]